jgi:hypothetical protein
MDLTLKEAAEELERIASRRSPAMEYLDETREAFRERMQDLIYRAYGVHANPPPSLERRRSE